MKPKELLYVLLSAIVVCFVGCGDPVRTTAQVVRLRVIDSASRKPIVGAEVLLKDDFEVANPLSQQTGQPPLSPKETHEHLRRAWEQRDWFRGVTDEDGRADIIAEYTVLDRSHASKPPAWRDFVTGQPYLIRVKARKLPETRVWTEPGESPEESVSIVMSPGETAKGRTVTITLVEIEEPRYITTHR